MPDLPCTLKRQRESFSRKDVSNISFRVCRERFQGCLKPQEEAGKQALKADRRLGSREQHSPPSAREDGFLVEALVDFVCPPVLSAPPLSGGEQGPFLPRDSVGRELGRARALTTAGSDRWGRAPPPIMTGPLHSSVPSVPLRPPHVSQLASYRLMLAL